MNLSRFLISFSISLMVFFAIDMLWLGLIAKDLYRRHIGHLMADQVRWSAALLFYALYLIALQYFVIQPALHSSDPLQALINGALLGLLCYATYDLTNLATLKNWPVSLSIIDMVWGTVLTGLTCWLTTLISLRFFA